MINEPKSYFKVTGSYKGTCLLHSPKIRRFLSLDLELYMIINDSDLCEDTSRVS